ncbi:4-nitrophenyl phosphatase [Weissella uvarum]|uniref:TIGR01457 family HAD-type hydrolase n=1 Tax=Weissella uvarum TaxID=1479233 RepID=UPI0019614E65|nr:TIGR01457 family HAD-type hydrolase [Weissella uvarum]MBM7616522.1 4-nitrophenyl phosphatase [Weissella uvarum]MCM0595017.1 TIGR01457 family HAD-type hydrolase [Weissella uvarum]
MTHFKHYFIDLDGTIYQGKNQFPSGRRFIERLKQAQIDYLFVTNNSTKTPAEVAENLTLNHDIPTTEAQVYTSAMATADYLVNQQVQRALVVGEVGLTDALERQGIDIVQTAQEQPQAVVVGLDRNISYEKLAQATLAIQGGAAFIATNVDTNLPNERGLLPGAGTIVAAVQTATQTEPVVIGKPATPIMQQALKRVDAIPDEVIMVGDNYQTDILAGINTQMATLLVYSGVSTPEQIATVAQQPTYVVDSLDDWSIE